MADQRKRELDEAEEIQERGTLTPEAGKQGVTSHLPVEETEFMYRSEEHDDSDGDKERKLRRSA